MARGSKNYSEVTHKASKEGTKAKQKAVWDMIGAKKKLHEMVEALIGGDSKAAAAALHEYLQAKTRAVLGENDEEMSLDLDSEDMGSEGGEEHEHEDGEEGECPECHMEPCECEDKGEGHEDMDLDLDDEGGEEHLDIEDHLGESNDTKATSTFKGAHNNAAKDLGRKVKGNIKFATKGKAKLTKPHNNAAPGLDRKVKGDIKFNTNGKAKLTHPHDNAAPGLDRKVKGTVKF
jgi:hypothetical protein